MSFISLEFVFFLPVVFFLYWSFRKNFRLKNILIVLASFVFYAWWDAHLVSLIVFSALVDYTAGLVIDRSRTRCAKKMALAASLFANLGMLGLFKYYDFFAASLVQMCAGIGIQLDIASLNLVLPVGISFYTFQTLSYTVDLYRGRIQAVKDPVQFFTFVSFFP